MRRIHILLAFLLFLGAHPTAVAQGGGALKPTPDSMVTQLTLRDGSVLVGRVLAVTDSALRVRSALGETTVPLSMVVSARTVPVNALHDGVIWPEDPSRTRLLFAPTGRMLRQSETYFTDAYLFFPGVQTGITDNVSLGGGMSLFPGLAVDKQLFFVTPKVGIYQSPTVNVAVGALVAGAKDISDYSPFGIGYGVVTYGDEENSVTAGAGFGFSRRETTALSLFMLGGTTRVSRGVALVTENYFAANGGSGFLGSGGVRFIGEHLSTDLALLLSEGVVAPYVAFIYRF